MNAVTINPTAAPTFPAAAAQSFADYLLGQELQIKRQGLEACTTAAQRRGWLDGLHYSCLPEGADPEMWNDERRALYARYGVKMNGEVA